MRTHRMIPPAAFLLFLLFTGLCAAEAPASGLIISEVVSGNYRSYYSSGRRGADLVEIRNLGPERVLLSDYCLSDSRNNLGKYTLPGKTLKPGEFFLVECDESGGKNRAGFKISSSGETLYLSGKDGKVTDRLKVPSLPLDIAYGRNDAGEERYFASFTPLGANGAGYTRIARAPVLSVPSGGYDAPFRVEITGEEPVYYTLDGSVPTPADTRYTGPIEIKETVCLRAVSAPDGALPSAAANALYRFDCGSYALPTLTVSLSRNSLKSGPFGLLSHVMDKSMAVPAVATLIGADGSLEFSRECGLGISGQTSRGRTYRGWKLKFKGMYGGKLQYAVFPESGQKEYDTLNLRVGSSFNPTQDALGTAIGEAAMPAVICQRFRPVNLFIRDTGYGVYYLRENINPFFVASRLGGSEEQVDIIYRAYEVEEGSGEDWKELLSFCRTHDLSAQENYDYVCSRVNAESWIDYYIWRAYTGDTDYPNFRVARCRDAADPRWHLIMYDLDWAFQMKNKDAVSLGVYAYRSYDSAKRNNLVLTSLFRNDGFRKLFLERLAFHLRDTFAPERVNGLLDGILAEVMPDMPATWAVRNASRRKWEADAEEIRRFIGEGETDRRIRLIRETRDFFKLSEEETRALFGEIYVP